MQDSTIADADPEKAIGSLAVARRLANETVGGGGAEAAPDLRRFEGRNGGGRTRIIVQGRMVVLLPGRYGDIASLYRRDEALDRDQIQQGLAELSNTIGETI